MKIAIAGSGALGCGFGYMMKKMEMTLHYRFLGRTHYNN
ncbi:MAG: hypothetical protein ACFWUI_07705 [Clostridium sp.]